MQNLYVDMETGQIATQMPQEVETRSELFDFSSFDSLEKAIQEASLCDPLSTLIEQLDDELWYELEQGTSKKQDDLNKILSAREDFNEPSDILKTLNVTGDKTEVLRSINSWLLECPDAEDWDYAGESGNPFLEAFRFFSLNGIPDCLDIDLVEGFYPGDNTQVAVLRMNLAQANALSKLSQVKFIAL
ncbi:hypothetical protein NBRC116589_13460 [Ruegeria sp. HU-ET01832]|uniref:hypothetical protein n=1 Tax=Ruegeria sp. HU-ET01832 TaxID=3135906 RepID=UPI00310A4FFA